MSRNKKSALAKIDHVLVYYDGPQLVLLRVDDKYKTLGVAVDIDGYDYPLICASVLPRYFDSYLNGRVDLRFLFEVTPARRLYITDMSKAQDGLKLHRVGPDLITDETLPERGIFSSVHTHPIKSSAYVEDDQQKFLIDGTWEARDFSQFNGKIADIYSMLFIAEKLGHEKISTGELSFLKESIGDRNWLGGGSYLSFYGSVKTHAISTHPLRVVGLSYHSPGYINLAGRKVVLDMVTDGVANLIENYREIVNTYSNLRKYLSREGLLSSDSKALFASASAKEFAVRQTYSLCRKLGIPNSQEIYRACDGNAAVFAKVILSYFRRLKGIANFYIEGRVQSPR